MHRIDIQNSNSQQSPLSSLKGAGANSLGGLLLFWVLTLGFLGDGEMWADSQGGAHRAMAARRLGLWAPPLKEQKDFNIITAMGSLMQTHWTSVPAGGQTKAGERSRTPGSGDDISSTFYEICRGHCGSKGIPNCALIFGHPRHKVLHGDIRLAETMCAPVCHGVRRGWYFFLLGDAANGNFFQGQTGFRCWYSSVC